MALVNGDAACAHRVRNGIATIPVRDVLVAVLRILANCS